jgi:hypothetical protein
MEKAAYYNAPTILGKSRKPVSFLILFVPMLETCVALSIYCQADRKDRSNSKVKGV